MGGISGKKAAKKAGKASAKNILETEKENQRRRKLDLEGVPMLPGNHVFCGPGLNEDFEDNSLAGFL